MGGSVWVAVVNERSAIVIVYVFVALSGALMGALSVWVLLGIWGCG